MSGNSVDHPNRAPEKASSGTPRPRIVAVDDQRDSLRVLQLRLQAAGMECFAFSNGPDALQFLAKEPADVVILDVMMPQMDGYEVCKVLKTDERTRDIPVLFLTAKLDMEDRIYGLEVGGKDYLSKPVEQQELLARTRAALRVKHLQDELKGKLQLQGQVNRLHQDMLGEHWQKTLGQLAASLAHEINNPLAVALGTVQLLSLEECFTKEVADKLQIIDGSLQRAGNKLRSLLLIAQTNRQQQKVAISQFLEDLLTLVNFQLVINKVALETKLEKTCEWNGSSGQLARAILYILNNAIEAVVGRSHACILIKVEQAEDAVLIHVVDNGPGVPADIQSRVFEPFFTTKGQPHNGVGLHLALEIIHTVGGTIELKSPSELGATDFIIRLAQKR